MRRFADPEHCPDCGSRLATGTPVCPECHLDLGGALGLELYTTLTRADELLARMRRPVPAATVAVGSPSMASPLADTPATPRPQQPLAPPASSAPLPLRGSSVPKILLTLGAACLLVAALVFLAVTWARLGVGGRTAILVGLTVTSGALTRWLAGRALRAAVESLGVVTLGLLALDLYGADNAGWFGALSDSAVTTLVGAALLAAGLGSTALLGATKANGFTGGEVAAALGAAIVSWGLADQHWGSVAGRMLFATVLVLALTVAVWRVVREGRNLYRAAGWMLVLVLGLDWTVLVLIGLDDLGYQPTTASAWGELDGWPLVAAGAVALLVSAYRRPSLAVRVAAAATGLVPIGLAVLAPTFDEPTIVSVPAVAGSALALVVLMVAARSPWGAAGAAGAALCGVVLLIEAVHLTALAVAEYVRLSTAGWRGTPDGRVDGAAELGLERGMLLLCTAVLLALVWAGTRLVRPVDSPWVRGTVPAAAGFLTGAALATMLLYSLPVWAVLAAGLTVSVAAALPVLLRDDAVSAALTGAPLLGTVVLSWYDERLTAVTLLVAVGLVAAVHLRTRRVEVAAASAALLAAGVAGLSWSLGAVLDVAAPATGPAGLVALAALVLARPYLPQAVGSRRVDIALEVAAAFVAVVLAATAIEAAPVADRPTWLAVHLTVAGAAVTLLALLRPGRRHLAWLGGLLLAAATWVRLWEVGVTAPEPYTLPSASALLAVGLVSLHRRPSGSTQGALGAGLALALVPSLLWVLAEPTGPRPLLLGLGCLALVVLGAQLRWAAPLAYGAAVGLAVVLREAAPYLGGSVPRWALIGAAGALLIAMGVTWEQRVRNARSMSTYLRALR